MFNALFRYFWYVFYCIIVDSVSKKLKISNCFWCFRNIISPSTFTTPSTSHSSLAIHYLFFSFLYSFIIVMCYSTYRHWCNCWNCRAEGLEPYFLNSMSYCSLPSAFFNALFFILFRHNVASLSSPISIYDFYRVPLFEEILSLTFYSQLFILTLV